LQTFSTSPEEIAAFRVDKKKSLRNDHFLEVRSRDRKPKGGSEGKQAHDSGFLRQQAKEKEQRDNVRGKRFTQRKKLPCRTGSPKRKTLRKKYKHAQLVSDAH